MYSAASRGRPSIGGSWITLPTFILCVLTVYIPYQIYLDFGTGIPGINGANLLFLLAFLLMRRTARTQDTKTPLKGVFVFYFVVVSLAFAIALMHGGRPALDDVNYWKSLLFYPLLYFLFFHAIKTRDDARWVVAAILLVVGVAALQAFRQGLDYGLGNFNETRRAAGPFSSDWSNSNRAGVFFAMFAPVMAVVATLYRERRLIRLGAAVGLFLCIMATFVTYSRQSYVILAAVLMLFMMRRSLLIAVFGCILILSYESWLPSAAVQRIQMTQTAGEVGGGDEELDESTESRFIIWSGAAMMIAENPFGVGLQRFRENLGQYSQIKNMDAHNYYILTTAEAGILGGAALFVLIGGLFFLPAPLFKMKEDPNALVLAWSHRLCTIALILGNTFGSSFNFGELMSSYWILSAVVARYRSLPADGAPAEFAPSTGRRVSAR